MPHHVFGDSGFGHLKAQLAVNAWCAPSAGCCGSVSGSDPEPLAGCRADLVLPPRILHVRTSQSSYDARRLPFQA